MKTKALILSISVLALSLSSCNKQGWPYCVKADGNIVEETRILSDFDHVSFDLSGDLTITQDQDLKVPEIRIRTSENILERIETDVKGDELRIDSEKCIRKLKTFEAFLIVPDIRSVSLNGSGNIVSGNTFETEEIKLEINGSGNIEFDVEAELVESDISGSGDIELDGMTEDFQIDINGSGNINAYGLPTQYCFIDVRGSGSCEVNVEQTLDVDISGSGNVTYMGTPAVTFENNGSGSIKAK